MYSLAQLQRSKIHYDCRAVVSVLIHTLVFLRRQTLGRAEWLSKDENMGSGTCFSCVKSLHMPATERRGLLPPVSLKLLFLELCYNPSL